MNTDHRSPNHRSPNKIDPIDHLSTICEYTLVVLAVIWIIYNIVT